MSKTKQKLLFLRKKIEKLESGNAISRFLFLKGTIRKYRKLHERYFYLADQYLVDTDTDYLNLTKRCLAALENQDLKYTVSETRNGHGYGGKFTRSFEGNLRQNGYSYCHATSGGLAESFVLFGSFAYAKSFTGKVDHFGRVSLKMEKMAYSVFRSLPQHYHGSVDKSGRIELQVADKSSTDFWLSGNLYIRKMLANHFEYDENRNEHFQQLRDQLIDQVYDFMERDGIVKI